MTKKELKQWLQENSDPKYRNFTAKLLPGVENICGIRLPKLRKLAKQIVSAEPEQFLKTAEDGSFEEIMLQGLVISALPETDAAKQKRLMQFITKINNWSVCDSVCASLKNAEKNAAGWWDWLQPLVCSEKEFTARFGIVMLLFHFINADWVDKVLQTLNRPYFSGYYAQMAAGWAIAEIYAKFPERAFVFLQQNDLPPEVQNKAIRKICESLRTTPQEKQSVRNLKK